MTLLFIVHMWRAHLRVTAIELRRREYGIRPNQANPGQMWKSGTQELRRRFAVSDFLSSPLPWIEVRASQSKTLSHRLIRRQWRAHCAVLEASRYSRSFIGNWTARATARPFSTDG